MQATHPRGRALVKLVTIEAKRGYRDSHVGDLFDLNPKVLLKPRPLIQHLDQAERQSSHEDTPFWLLVVRRDKRLAVVYMPADLYVELCYAGATLKQARPKARVRAGKRDMFMTTLDQFFEHVDPAIVRSLRREFRR